MLHAEDNRRARGGRAAAADRRRISRRRAATRCSTSASGCATNADHLRRALMLEPRGHADMYGAILTEPVVARLARRRPVHAQRGLQHDVRPRHHRGDDDGARARAADAGRRRATRSSTTRRQARFALERTAARWGRSGGSGRSDGRVESVAFLNVPSFVLHGGLAVKLARADDPRRRRLRRRLLRDRRQRSGRAADRRRAPAGAAPRRHGDQARDRSGADHRPSARCRADRASTARSSPARRATTRADLRNVTIFADAEVDRSPCGTGTAAVMAVVDAMGLLGDERPFVHESLIGTRSTAASRRGRRSASSRRSCRRSKARPGSPASTRS